MLAEICRSVGWVEQGETQHTQQSFFHLLGDVCVDSVAPSGETHVKYYRSRLSLHASVLYFF
jgi:hypothetical protein